MDNQYIDPLHNLHGQIAKCIIYLDPVGVSNIKQTQKFHLNHNFASVVMHFFILVYFIFLAARRLATISAYYFYTPIALGNRAFLHSCCTGYPTVKHYGWLSNLISPLRLKVIQHKKTIEFYISQSLNSFVLKKLKLMHQKKIEAVHILQKPWQSCAPAASRCDTLDERKKEHICLNSRPLLN